MIHKTTGPLAFDWLVVNTIINNRSSDFDGTSRDFEGCLPDIVLFRIQFNSPNEIYNACISI